MRQILSDFHEINSKISDASWPGKTTPCICLCWGYLVCIVLTYLGGQLSRSGQIEANLEDSLDRLGRPQVRWDAVPQLIGVLIDTAIKSLLKTMGRLACGKEIITLMLEAIVLSGMFMMLARAFIVLMLLKATLIWNYSTHEHLSHYSNNS